MDTPLQEALGAMNLEEEEDTPLMIPDRPEYSAVERNQMSLIGKALNPPAQKMSSLILDLPRKWGLEGQIRGIALSQEKFQFIFQHQLDLDRVLDQGVWTYNDWSLVMEKWQEQPLEDYLQHILVWVRIRHIPVNHLTEATIMFIGDILGEVKEVAFDPLQPQTRDFVRVQVKFNVNNPLRRAKKIQTPTGDVFTVFFDFEKVQRRCYTCQRMNHSKENCPFTQNTQSESDSSSQRRIRVDQQKITEYLQPSDPLYGVLKENQVGIDPNTGRRRIDPGVMDHMRQYLLASDGSERRLREERVKVTVEEAEKDLKTKKSLLRLEKQPTISTDVDKGKGHVFDFSLVQEGTREEVSDNDQGKLLGAAIAIARKEIREENNMEVSTDPVLKDMEVCQAEVNVKIDNRGTQEHDSVGSSSGMAKLRKTFVRVKRNIRSGQSGHTKEDQKQKEIKITGSSKRRLEIEEGGAAKCQKTEVKQSQHMPDTVGIAPTQGLSQLP